MNRGKRESVDLIETVSETRHKTGLVKHLMNNFSRVCDNNGKSAEVLRRFVVTWSPEKAISEIRILKSMLQY